MRVGGAGSSGVGAAATAAFVATAALVALAVYLMNTAAYGVWGAFLIVPALFLISLPVLSRQANREHDPTLFVLLAVALALKLLGAVARYYVEIVVLGGHADTTGYHKAGAILAERFQSGIFLTGPRGLTGTRFIRLPTGVIYTVIGPNRLGAYLVFSWLAFWGLFLFYRAFTIAVPEGRRRSYGKLIFFLPSLLFWPSAIGKDAWMVFALGIAAIGGAYCLSGKLRWGLATAGLGLWLAAIVRPHVAALMAIALGGGYLLGRSAKDLRQLAPVVKTVAIILLLVAAVLLVSRTESFLQGQGIETDSGLTSVLEQTSERTTRGGSGFTPSVFESLQQIPIAAVTVLFRPFLFEAHNSLAVVAALEGSFLLLLSLVRVRWIFAALKSVRRQAYAAFAILYAGMFIVAFSSIGNFGLLVRERAQLLPIFLVLLSIPPRESRQEPSIPSRGADLSVRPREPQPAGAARGP